MIRHEEVENPKWFFVTMVCDECNTEMKQEPIAFTTYPLQYRYYCPKCGNTQMSTNTYPQIEMLLGEKSWIIPI